MENPNKLISAGLGGSGDRIVAMAIEEFGVRPTRIDSVNKTVEITNLTDYFKTGVGLNDSLTIKSDGTSVLLGSVSIVVQYRRTSTTNSSGNFTCMTSGRLDDVQNVMQTKNHTMSSYPSMAIGNYYVGLTVPSQDAPFVCGTNVTFTGTNAWANVTNIRAFIQYSGHAIRFGKTVFDPATSIFDPLANYDLKKLQVIW